jgi:hypothetical protein
VAALTDGKVLVWYGTASLDDDGFAIRESERGAFVVFDASGARIGSVSVPPDIKPYPWSLYVSPVTGHLLVGSHDPYPSVVELRLVEVK